VVAENPCLPAKVLTAIAAVRDRIGEMLSAGQLNGHTRMGTLNVDFQCSKTIEGDRQRHVDLEAAFGLR
jgi:hypothetical protein